MTAPQAPLSPPPPLAAISQDQSRTASALDAPPLQSAQNPLNGADILAGTTQNAPPDQYWEEDVPPAEMETAAIDSAPEADSKSKKYDFFGQVHELAYSSQAQKTERNFKAMEKSMIDQNLLPEFTISESLSPPPIFALDTGRKQMETSLNHYRDRYFALKTQA
ncbi:MAG: hypothetical protein K2Y39_27800 [Candidatus Obscuribacterales bacterium]|nr:hypothetical protein [Candidatus Obscuribacterales bacterium]